MNVAMGLQASPQHIEAHHLLRGGRRIGHEATIALCHYHHQGYLPEGYNNASARIAFGPSLAKGSKPFHAMYGTDEELLNYQNTLLNMLTK